MNANEKDDKLQAVKSKHRNYKERNEYSNSPSAEDQNLPMWKHGERARGVTQQLDARSRNARTDMHELQQNECECEGECECECECQCQCQCQCQIECA
jgi:hypothetical protein